MENNFEMGIYEEFIYKRTYARWLENEQRRENFNESIDRYKNFFKPYTDYNESIKDDFENAIDDFRNLKVVPSMRTFYSAGPALEDNHIASYNCSAIIIDDIKRFGELLLILMHGCGCGISVERQYIVNLPEVPEKLIEIDKVIIAEDSKYGWQKCLDEYIEELFKGNICKYDLSLLRPKGARLKTFGGRSSGPEVFDMLLKNVFRIIDKAKGRKLRSIECHDICCHVAHVVVAGGVRRSSLISLSNLSDERMRSAKEGEFWIHNPQRMMSNNSVCYTEKPDLEIFIQEWLSLMKSGTGERGIFNREACENIVKKNGRRKQVPDFITNPCCFTGDMSLLTIDGYKSFKELSKLNNIKIINKNGDISDGKVWAVKEKETIEIIVNDRDTIRCTPDHMFMLDDGTECQAKNLLGKKLKRYHNKNDSNVVINIFESSKEMVYDFNEPLTNWGVVNGFVVHNSEIILRPSSFCNLTEVIVRTNDTLEILKEKVRSAVLFGCLQSMLTDFKGINENFKKNCEEERLLGVSLTGVRDHEILKTVNPEAKKYLKEMKKYAIQCAKEFSKKLNINMPSAVTCLKPSGTVSQMVNTSSGIHTRFSPYYIRRVRVTKTDKICEFLISKGIPFKPEVGETLENCNTVVFEFPIESPKGCVCNRDITAIEQLEYWKMFQLYWCEHKPSCTTYVDNDEWLEVGAWVYKNWDIISGISFLPKTDSIYQLPPYEEITSQKYNEMKKSFPKFDFKELEEFEKEDTTIGSKELACSGGSCELF